MPLKRTLPERRNALIEPENSPSHEVLVERRRLGQTNLAVRPGVVGVSNASKAENLGTFDYAHLRVPLPKDLSGSGIFTLKSTTSYPESYFLMRRSNDGNISATGMFKAAFPWASLAEEETERRYQKSFASAGSEEVAGSVWISPKEALELADEYGMRLWILALLDPRPIEKGQKDRNNPHIDNPPRFDIDSIAPVVLPPSSSLRPARARSSRSVSPSKIATPSRKMASPRKSRTTRAAKAAAANGEEIVERATRASSALQNVFENGTTASESVASESVNGDVKDIKSVRINVEETDELDGEVETKHTNVTIDVPADHPELPTPEDPTKLMEEARKMVEAARELDGEAATSSRSKSKRKAEEIARDEDEVDGAIDERPAKQARTTTALEQQAKKDKMVNRTFMGVGAMFLMGFAATYLS